MFDQYALFIKRSAGGTHYEIFGTIRELREAVSEYLTQREIKSGILDKLTTFNPKQQKDGYVENKWQNISACAYLK